MSVKKTTKFISVIETSEMELHTHTHTSFEKYYIVTHRNRECNDVYS